MVSRPWTPHWSLLTIYLTLSKGEIERVSARRQVNTRRVFDINWNYYMGFEVVEFIDTIIITWGKWVLG
jgi:hypothetical protein